MIEASDGAHCQPVTVTLDQLRAGEFFSYLLLAGMSLKPPGDPSSGGVPDASLEEAFGPASLGIIFVKGLPSEYAALRSSLLSYASYLADLPAEILGSD